MEGIVPSVWEVDAWVGGSGAGAVEFCWPLGMLLGTGDIHSTIAEQHLLRCCLWMKNIYWLVKFCLEAFVEPTIWNIPKYRPHKNLPPHYYSQYKHITDSLHCLLMLELMFPRKHSTE